tara:strand:- start:109 stop:765 length:657 start_codon:yes stop_codon:yes gene_type:complete
MFTKLKSPLETDYTREYSEFKELILGPNFGWSYNDQATPGYTDYVQRTVKDNEETDDIVGEADQLIKEKTQLAGYQQKVTRNGDLAFYSHGFLQGPSPMHKWYPNPNSEYLPYVEPFLAQIFNLNNISPHCVYRINANAVHPVEGNVLTVPHYDHEFPHKNLIVYLTDVGGDTIVFDDKGKKHVFTPKEDDIVVFEGLHCMIPPKKGRRVIIVVTYLD